MQIQYEVRKDGEDLEALQNMLQANNLPFEDLDSSNTVFLVAVCEGRIIGMIGLQQVGVHGLLRSFAVLEAYKNKGIGSELLSRLLDKSLADHIHELHLLTTTTEGYFTKKGFEKSNRENAPEGIQQTSEFSKICPSSATYMRLVVG